MDHATHNKIVSFIWSIADDGQLLFLMEMVSKMKRLQDSPAGSCIATVHNGPALFTGNAGGGASNIRQILSVSD